MLGCWTEAFNRMWYEKVTGNSVSRAGEGIQCPRHDWRRCTLDGFVEAAGAVEKSAEIARDLSDLLPVIVPIDPIETVIDQMLFVRSFAGQGVVVDSNIGPGDNWARYRLEVSSEGLRESGTGRLSFFALWQNKRNSPTIVTARANIVVNASLSCDASWNGVASWFGMDSDARANARVRTTVWNMDSSVHVIVHDQLIGGAGVSGDFFGDDTSDSIAFNELLAASGVAVLAQAYALIEVELLTEWSVMGGSVVLDAEGGSRRVAVPQIVLTQVHTPEPTPTPTSSISLAATVNYATTPATVVLNWSGATSNQVDIYQNGALLRTGNNDGEARVALGPGSYTFRVCNIGSSVCSTDVSVTVT